MACASPSSPGWSAGSHPALAGSASDGVSVTVAAMSPLREKDCKNSGAAPGRAGERMSPGAARGRWSIAPAANAIGLVQLGARLIKHLAQGVHG